MYLTKAEYLCCTSYTVFFSLQFTGKAGESFHGRSLTVENAGHYARRKHVPHKSECILCQGKSKRLFSLLDETEVAKY